ncbi:alpha-L-fucosidase [Carboxylicivirga sp. N1Y90]|uniref:alpha-L-fucosidase n=1 Tax=Carboxylicivirga fragile TaxID=3417571 RepID=UPI003D34A817|nr:alpha-L-fucosidase [Marinilabiliaceae bacterium N1Y90]
MNWKFFILVSIVSLSACTIEKERSYEKLLAFEKGTDLEEKVVKSAHVVPTKQQLDWQKLEMTAFIHFTVNTFTDMEWGHGDESPSIFNPTELDVRQWVKTLKDGGMKMVILTAKHHDGFCLWPTKTTKHSVVSTLWKDGKGDVVKELKEACDEFDLKFGVYLSPWDRNAECYGDSPRYNDFFNEQLTELLTWYGKVDEVWFDGACGEGPNGKKQEYDWESYYNTIKKLQPDAVVAVSGEDVRWVGTESGYGRETEWSVTPFAPGATPQMQAINDELGLSATSKDLGSRAMIEKADHLFWYPAEVDVSIRPGWFYHKHEDDKVKSLTKMVDIYFNSVGMNAVLLLNIPPDTRGLIHENDVARLKEFKTYLDETFENNLCAGAQALGDKNANKAIDGDYDTYWELNELPASVVYELPEAKKMNVVMLQEYIAKGQRVERFKVEVKIDDKWQEVVTGTSIGYKRLLRFPSITSKQIKLTILQARDGAMINTFGLFNSPDILSDPIISRSLDGEVSIVAETPHPVITYTLDGSEPSAESKVYTKPFALPNGGTVKAKAFIQDFKKASGTKSQQYDICKAKWSVIDYSYKAGDFGAENAIDGNPNTMWHTPWGQDVPKHPHHISVDLGEKLALKGFTYTPRTDDNKSGTIFKYAFYVSNNGKDWKKVKTKGEFSNIKNNPVKQEIRFQRSYSARYFKFESKEGIYNEDWIAVGELGVITK